MRSFEKKLKKVFHNEPPNKKCRATHGKLHDIKIDKKNFKNIVGFENISKKQQTDFQYLF